MREVLELVPSAIEIDRSAVVQRLTHTSHRFSSRDRKDGTQRGFLSNEATSRTPQYGAGDELRKGQRRVPYLRSQQITGEKCGLRSPGLSEPGRQLKEALARAEDLFITTAVPRGVVESTDRKTFTDIYRGIGDNDHDTPLELVLEKADSLALFAVTLGPAISDKVANLFSKHEYLDATLLDAMASMAAEQMVENLEARFASQIKIRKGLAATPAVLAYSPGYCGWNVSGQTALFSVLKPEQIGVNLGPGCMMRPLKSVSGVLISGEPQAHEFDIIFSCCSGCATLECRSRIERVAGPVDTTTEVAWTCSSE